MPDPGAVALDANTEHRPSIESRRRQVEVPLLLETLAADRRVLDLFSYTGGFAVAAARGGAKSVTLVDSSAAALDFAERNLAENGATCAVQSVKSDAFQFLRGSPKSSSTGPGQP